MILDILPSSLYGSANIEVLLKSDLSSIIHKSLSKSIINKKMYLSSVAILLVIKGKQIIRKYDGTDLVVTENEMVLLPKDLYVVSDFVINKNNFEAVIFFIDDSLIKKFSLLNSDNINNNKLKSKILKTNITSLVNKYIHSLGDIYKNVTSNQMILEVKILEFLLLLEQHDTSKILISSLTSSIKKRNIKEFMELHYLDNLKINDYAALTGRSVSTFNREFKRLYGTTPNKWLIRKRLSKSHDLLKSTNLTVTQISMEVGYDNVSHFIDAYKKIYKVTPKSTSKSKC